MTNWITTGLLAAFLATTSLNVSANEFPIGRYVLKEDRTDAAVPLNVPSNIVFPTSIQTVGDAINFALKPTGYHVDLEGSPSAYLLFSHPLPESHRALGSLRLRTLLDALAGPAFSVTVNHLYRTVSFDSVLPLSATEIEVAQKVWSSRPIQPVALKTYTVSPGDTMARIASKHGIARSGWSTWINRTVRRNPSAFVANDPNRLLAGAQLELPNE